MLTFEDHRWDGDLAAKTVRAFTHATMRFDHVDEPLDDEGNRPEYPDDSYQVLGNVLAIVRSLSQVVQQVDGVQRRALEHAVGEDGHPATGRALTQDAHRHLREAVMALEQVHTSLERASRATSRIIWPPHGIPGPAARRIRVGARSPGVTTPPLVGARATGNGLGL